ncbi:uncharacterized protein MONOS_17614 [Monocercomonoides exilis]|uniref:uncharacterized protein n=1 Tax=Monocercomonoides exilis TaxID=2049356 RepID=UPI003559C387|nr:hypothetical protein MONOS_17614 [Monocercomonoides exilis]
MINNLYEQIELLLNRASEVEDDDIQSITNNLLTLPPQPQSYYRRISVDKLGILIINQDAHFTPFLRLLEAIAFKGFECQLEYQCNLFNLQFKRLGIVKFLLGICEQTDNFEELKLCALFISLAMKNLEMSRKHLALICDILMKTVDQANCSTSSTYISHALCGLVGLCESYSNRPFVYGKIQYSTLIECLNSQDTVVVWRALRLFEMCLIDVVERKKLSKEQEFLEAIQECCIRFVLPLIDSHEKRKAEATENKKNDVSQESLDKESINPINQNIGQAKTTNSLPNIEDHSTSINAVGITKSILILLCNFAESDFGCNLLCQMPTVMKCIHELIPTNPFSPSISQYSLELIESVFIHFTESECIFSLIQCGIIDKVIYMLIGITNSEIHKTSLIIVKRFFDFCEEKIVHIASNVPKDPSLLSQMQSEHEQRQLVRFRHAIELFEEEGLSDIETAFYHHQYVSFFKQTVDVHVP